MLAGNLAHTVSVALVDDHPVVIEGVESWISRDERVRLVGTGGSVEEVMAGPGAGADVLVLDLNLDGTLVLDQVAELSAAGRRVVVFSQETREQIVLAAIEAGARAYLAKHEGSEHFVATVVAVAADRPYVTPAAAGAMWADDRPTRPTLSPQERSALLLWFQGMSKSSVALRMNISVHTADQYIDRARIKYARAGRPGPTKAMLLARAIEDRLISPEEVGEYRSRAAQAHPQGSGRTPNPRLPSGTEPAEQGG